MTPSNTKRVLAVTTLLLLAAFPAAAADYNQPGTLCRGRYASQRANLISNFYAQSNNSTTAAAMLLCPIDWQGTTMDPGTIFAGVLDRSATGAVQCTAYLTTASGALYQSATASTSATGWSSTPYHLTIATDSGGSIPANSLSTPPHWGVKCSVPARTTNGLSGVIGYRSSQL